MRTRSGLLRASGIVALVLTLALAACGGSTPAPAPASAPAPAASPAAQAPAPAAPASSPAAAAPAPAASPAAAGYPLAGAAASPAAAAPTGGQAPTPGGTLTVAYVASSTHIDINSVNQGSVNEIAHYIYETLFDRDSSGKIVPLLAREEQVSSDGLTVTWRLQPNVKFHDGSPFTAQAVKWNLERKVEKKQPLYDLLPIKTIETPDDTTVRLTLTRPAPSMNAYLATKTFSMYSPSFTEKVGDDGIKLQASGTGPFQVTEFKPNEILRMKRFPDYWQKDRVYLDEVVFRIAPDINARSTMLQAGDVDMALGLSIPDIEKLKTTRGFKVIEGLGSQQYYITINNKRAPLDDVKVRQALNYAVDKEGIIKTVFLGAAKPATAVYINPTVDGYSEGGSYPYNPDTAAKLLDEAGWKLGASGVREKDGKPLSLELVTRKGGSAGDYETAELVQGMLQAVGVDCKLTVEEAATFVTRVTKPPAEATYDLVLLTFGSFPGDAEYAIMTAYITDSFAPRYYNRAYYSNPEVDRLANESMKATTRAERDRIYAQIIKQVVADAPIIMLFDSLQQAALKDTLNGVYLEPAGNNFPAKYAWKAR